MDDPLTFADVVRAILEEDDMSPTRLAHQAELAPQAVFDILAQRRENPRTDTVEKVLRATGRPWAYLDRFAGPDRPPTVTLAAWEWQVVRAVKKCRKKDGLKGGDIRFAGGRKTPDAGMLRRLEAAGLIKRASDPEPPAGRYDVTPKELRCGWVATAAGRKAAETGEYKPPAQEENPAGG